MRTRQRVSLFACYLPAEDVVPVGPRLLGMVYFISIYGYFNGSTALLHIWLSFINVNIYLVPYL